MNYINHYINQIICGNCLEVMKTMPDNCVDTIITDPPYGLKFMGKKWDYDVPSIEIWQECLKVLKPGGTALIFAGSRTQHRMAVNVEDAGFILKDCIMWIYGSGFPKASDISKQIDKKAGKKRKILGYEERFGREGRKANCGFKKEYIGASGTQDQPAMKAIEEPATPEAILWNGWKSHGLKPAYEPILICMKPNEGSYANNALKWGVAGLNIDGGRIKYEKEDAKKAEKKNLSFKKAKRECIFSPKGKLLGDFDSKGRYPANVIHDGSDEVVGLFPNTGTSYRPNSRRGKIKSEIYMNGIVRDGYPTAIGVNDSGSASRFFYCAKASKSERNGGCEGLPDILSSDNKALKRICKKCGKRAFSGTKEQIQYRCQCINPEWETIETDGKRYVVKNNHPTVKPLALMKYLCTLTKTPTGGIVLDPFCGSGTTLMACKGLKRDYIGIDNKPEYCEIARRRVNAIPESLF